MPKQKTYCMDKKPIISVVIPVYNAEKYIAAAIESVLGQSYEDFELLVVNDCSTDGTRTVVESFAFHDKRVCLINLPTNKGGPAGPRNIGVLRARGRWIAFLDADDIWHPCKLQRQFDLLEKTGARFCSTQMVDFVDTNQLSLSDASLDEYEWVSFLSQLIKFRTPTSSVVVEKSLIERYPFNESMSYKAREDLDCWLHCHEEIARSVKITRPMMGYRIIPGQISGRKWTMFKRHLYVLWRYRFTSGRSLHAGALLFTISHFGLAIYYRLIKKGL
jgi:teichuronic acid biosynthesis glycosyltransferase TuaG